MFPWLESRIPRLGRLEKVFLSLLLLSLLAWVAQSVSSRPAPGRDLLHLAVYVVGFILLFKLLRLWIRKVLWRVRYRMIVLFLFIGLMPLILVTALAGLAGYVLTGQIAVYMATGELDRRASRLQGIAAALAWTLRTSEIGRRAGLVQSYVEPAAQNWPGVQALVVDAGRRIVFPPGANLGPPRAGVRDFRGLVRRENKLYLLAHVSGSSAVLPAEGPAGESVTARPPTQAEPPGTPPVAAGARDPLEVILIVPLSESFLDGLAPGLGKISFVPLRRAAGKTQGPEALRKEEPGTRVKVGSDTFTRHPTAAPTGSRSELPAAAHRFDYPVTWFTLPFQLERWREDDPEVNVSLQIQTRPSAVFRLLFGQRIEVAQGVVILFMIVGTLFLIVELLSLVIGISITRTLTKSVHQLYEGTQKVNRGDFSHRIPVGGHDQLAELSRSFNSMTESIERLIEESKERQRLASEIEIAREVQAQLFPKASPEMRGLQVLGVCNAARMVSGDYFDFVKLSEDRLALAIGDVAGKGISGALLMASIQSMLRTQLWAVGAASPSDGPVWRFPTAGLVSQLNVQLYQNTTPEKYATFFFGAYDDRHALLTYTNAGHLPPVVIRNGEPRRLDVNGMVIGAFPFAQYEQSEIELLSGDLVVGFTDGVTEPENEFAEEFGEPRLIELLVRNWRRPPHEIIDEVIAAVGQWTGRPELQDDMTMLVARRL